MSADLFALFDSSSEPSKRQPQQSTASSGTSQFSDPFSFLQPSTPPAPAPVRPQTNYQAPQWQSNASQQPPTGNTWGDLTGLNRPVSSSQAAEEEDDGWGDFETATQHAPAKPAAPVVQSQARPTARIVRASTMDLMTNSLISLGPTPEKPRQLDQLTERPSWETSTRQSTESRPKNTDPNMLFDADDFDGDAPPDSDDDDDFGDFEAPVTAAVTTQSPVDLISTSTTYNPQAKQSRQAAPSQLLSTLSLSDAFSGYPQAPKSPSFQERNPFPGLGLKTPIADEFPTQTEPKSQSPITAWPSFGDATETTEKNSFEAEWATFDHEPAKVVRHIQTSKPTATTSSQKATTTQPNPSSDWDWDAWAPSTSTDTPVAQPPNQPQTTSPTGPPPSNIPPPSVLLSIFPSLLTTASTSLFNPTATAPPPIKARVHTSPETITFLRGYLALATVAARIIAGRKLRWHRDKFLAQAMTISAATGGKGGMKLAGIDRAQAAREDAEAADVLAAWKGVVGRLRGAVAGANVALEGRKKMRVPELGEGMRVETVRGAVTAARACVVCGLRRDERVVGVDGEVEDSFGEWWVEFWGHRECRNFWVEHERALRSR